MSSDNTLDSFKKLRSMSERQVRLHHHLHSLRQYVDRKKVPAGLQIKLSPQTIGTTSNRFNKRWNTILTRCSLQLCSLLLGHTAHQSNSLEKSINVAKAKLSQSATQEQLNRFSKHINSCEKNLSNKLSNIRHRKLLRDGICNPDTTVIHTTTKSKPRNRRFHKKRDTTLSTNTVVNLSSANLSETEQKLLSKGLNFCPKPFRYNKSELTTDLQAFFRRLRLRDFFYDSADKKDQEAIPKFRKKSNWQPPKSKDPALEAYIQAVEAETESHINTTTAPDNLTKAEKQALTSLKNRTDITIKPADKGSAVVVMDTSDYIAEANRQLSDVRYYRQLDHDPTDEHASTVTELLTEMLHLGHIDDKTFEYLLPDNPKPGRLYLLPKIHKANHPGRPIISANGHPTEKISEFVDFHLRPLVEALPSYIRDTTDFLCKIRSRATPPGTFLVTMDVTSLYTNIPHDEGIAACRKALNTRSDKSVPTEYIIKLLRLILKLNNFEFNGLHYLQINGTAMGTKMAPSYANIFMGNLEKQLLSEAPNAPNIWLRFIDDIFNIWQDSEETLTDFLHFCNSFHPSIKFTAEKSTSHIAFLDTTVSIQNGEITTDLFTKPTDSHQYLLPSSCHPAHCTTSIPYSLAIRLRRICSSDDTFSHRCKELQDHLLRRNYPQTLLTDSIGKAKTVTRETALQYKPAKPNTRVPLVVTYHPDLPRLSDITRRLWNVILTSNRMRELFPEPPLLSYRKPRSLRNHLVRAKLDTTDKADATPGCRSCDDKRCHTCSNITNTNTFHSSVSDTAYKIFCATTCKSANVIYLIQCSVCKVQYVGETKNPVHKRMNQHRVSSKDPSTPFPVGIHFNQSSSHTHDWQNMELTIIECNPKWTDRERKEREMFWIRTLQTLRPRGLNLDPGVFR